MSALLELAERCEAATGPDTELDRCLFAVLRGVERDRVTGPMDFPATASIDAALTLVPEGASYDLRTAQTAPGALAMIHPTRMRPTVTVRGNTPALAICAAALRARDA